MPYGSKDHVLVHAVCAVVMQEISLPLAGPIDGCDDFSFQTDDCSSL